MNTNFKHLLRLLLAAVLLSPTACHHDNGTATDKGLYDVTCDTPPGAPDFAALDTAPLQYLDFQVLMAALANNELQLSPDDFIVYENVTFPIDRNTVNAGRFPTEEKILFFTRCSLVTGSGTTVPEKTPRVPFESEVEFRDLTAMYAYANFTPRSFTGKSLEAAGLTGVVVEQDEINALLATAGRWNNFYAAYPEAQGVIRFGAPAFSAEMNTALVYIEFACGDLCALGMFVLLRFESYEWRVVGEAVAWSS